MAGRRFGHQLACDDGAMEQHTMSTREAIGRAREVAAAADRPVLMLNLNQYTDAAGYPEGPAYRDYMNALHHAVAATGGSVLWQAGSEGQVIGCDHDDYDEVLAVWYPSHRSFLDLHKADRADEMFAGRETCVANASIVALPAVGPGLSPT